MWIWNCSCVCGSVRNIRLPLARWEEEPITASAQLTGQTGSASTYPIKVHWFKRKPYTPWWHVFNRIIQLSYPQITPQSHRIGQHKRISTMHPLPLCTGRRERLTLAECPRSYNILYVQCWDFFVEWFICSFNQSILQHVIVYKMLSSFTHSCCCWNMLFSLVWNTKNVNGSHKMKNTLKHHAPRLRIGHYGLHISEFTKMRKWGAFHLWGHHKFNHHFHLSWEGTKLDILIL